ncbi:hypothetical protein H1C71_038839, partial [Ictidomys tridecemlineatus]
KKRKTLSVWKIPKIYRLTSMCLASNVNNYQLMANLITQYTTSFCCILDTSFYLYTFQYVLLKNQGLCFSFLANGRYCYQDEDQRLLGSPVTELLSTHIRSKREHM